MSHILLLFTFRKCHVQPFKIKDRRAHWEPHSTQQRRMALSYYAIDYVCATYQERLLESHSGDLKTKKERVDTVFLKCLHSNSLWKTSEEQTSFMRPFKSWTVPQMDISVFPRQLSGMSALSCDSRPHLHRFWSLPFNCTNDNALYISYFWEVASECFFSRLDKHNWHLIQGYFISPRIC